MSDLVCGCYFTCRCEDKEAADKAISLLRLVDLKANAHLSPHSKYITLMVQPYEVCVYTNRGWGRYWSTRSLRYIKYQTVEGMLSGVNRIVKRKIDDPDYLSLPEGNYEGKFTLPNLVRNPKRKTLECRHTT